MRGAELLARAAAIYDASPRLQRARPTGFAGGAAWMREALSQLRGRELEARTHAWRAWGVGKYGLCALAAIGAGVAGTLTLGPLVAAPLAILAFYAVEARWVFLFPLLLDGGSWRDSGRWTDAAGGTWTVMTTVLPIAWAMLSGGLRGRGVVRSWCVGCLAVCLWYEGLHEGQR